MNATRRRVTRRLLVAGAVVAVVAACGERELDEAAQLERGAVLYDRHCVSCHGGATGGTISDIPPRHNAQGHTWHHPDCDLVRIVLDGLPQREGFPPMPAFGEQLDEADVDAILAHIKTWWEPDQRAFQAEVTEMAC